MSKNSSYNEVIKTDDKKVIEQNIAGRPPMYETPEEMQIIIDEYFNKCDGEILLDSNGDPMLNKYNEPIFYNKKAYTVTGLALALGFTSRQALINYQHKDRFVDTVTRAKMRCQEYAENRLYDKEGSNGAKFSLSNNFGWFEKQIIENNNTNYNHGADLSTLSIDELKQLIASSESKLIEADYTSDDE